MKLNRDKYLPHSLNQKIDINHVFLSYANLQPSAQEIRVVNNA